jgi:hypothetical protein
LCLFEIIINILTIKQTDHSNTQWQQKQQPIPLLLKQLLSMQSEIKNNAFVQKKWSDEKTIAVDIPYSRKRAYLMCKCCDLRSVYTSTAKLVLWGETRRMDFIHTSHTSTIPCWWISYMVPSFIWQTWMFVVNNK